VAINPYFPVDGRLRPPLVTELFDGRFANILDQYPLAAQIAPTIRQQLRSGVIALEDYLQDGLRHSPHVHLREAYWAIPLYLQHVLFDVSGGYTTEPDNYDRLISVTLQADRVTFITLNYDTILDGRLAIQARGWPASMRWYIDTNRKWSLVKLHGSIDWRRRILNASPVYMGSPTYASEYVKLGDHIELDDQIELVSAGGIDTYRFSRNPEGDSLYFPALAVPVRTKEEQTWCPPDQLAAIKDHMTHCFDGFNILVIGYRAVDDDVLSLFRWAGRPLRSLLVVDRSKKEALEVVNRFCDELPSHMVADRNAAAFDGNFRSFAQSAALDDYVGSL